MAKLGRGVVKPRFVIGFDPSLDGMGWFVLDCLNKNPKLAEKGTVTGRNATWGDTPHQEKLALIAAKTSELVAKYQPLYKVVFVEKGFSKFNNDTQAIFKARGAMESQLVGYDVVEYAPSTVKKSVTGNGSASKPRVQHDLAKKFGLTKDDFETEDESDAGGVAVTGYNDIFLKDFPDKNPI